MMITKEKCCICRFYLAQALSYICNCILYFLLPLADQDVSCLPAITPFYLLCSSFLSWHVHTRPSCDSKQVNEKSPQSPYMDKTLTLFFNKAVVLDQWFSTEDFVP